MPTQTSNGKAFEYACVLALTQIITPFRPVSTLASSALQTAKGFYLELSDQEQYKMLKAALAGAQPLLKTEPKITEDGDDEITLSIQADKEGIAGDVRDVLIIRRSVEWEIGVSVKNNHFAAKHSRLSQTINFGRDWFGYDCSKQYFNEIEPIFTFLRSQQSQEKDWHNMPDKIERVYIPLLTAFKKELVRLDSEYPGEVPSKLLEYLIGRRDFYKFVKVDNERKTIVQCYNFHGTLNKPSTTQRPEFNTGKVKLPNRIIELDFSERAPDTTLELVMNRSWTVTFRIHNASTLVEPSLKFDIHVSGTPSDLFTAHVGW